MPTELCLNDFTLLLGRLEDVQLILKPSEGGRVNPMPMHEPIQHSRPIYSHLEQLLELGPFRVKCSSLMLNLIPGGRQLVDRRLVPVFATSEVLMMITAL